MSHEVLVIGGGISGASFAFHAARAGRSVLVVEKDEQVGGCLHSERTTSGFWYELGAHTCYNSYQGLLEVLEGCDLLGGLQARGKPVLRFLDGERVVPGKNLGLLVRLFRKLELLRAVPRWIGASQDGESVRSYYSRLVGPRNYEEVLGPMLSAVPSQPAHEFPADMLFKKRPRREDVMRSYTLPGGLRSAVEAVLRQPRIEALTGRSVKTLARSGEGFVATLDDGDSIEAGQVVLAVPPGVVAELLRDAAPEVARHAAAIRQVEVQSLGFAVPAERVSAPYSTFLIPLNDTFHSIVTRDVVPDPERRGFTFHFRPDQTREQRLARVHEVLGVREEDMEGLAERRATLPSPVLGHADVVAALDRALDGERIAVTGNWFAGLSIEDCVLRSRAEWERLASAD
jgi:UDP-galactopyranose mutase